MPINGNSLTEGLPQHNIFEKRRKIAQGGGLVSFVFILLAGTILLCPLSSAGDSPMSGKESAYGNVKNYVSKHTAFRNVPTPEGAFVVAFNPEIAQWIARPLDKDGMKKIRERLAPGLKIGLTPRGFARAADRDTGGRKDTTHYDAIWVRDSVWIYFALQEQPERRSEARRLLLALWDYYATKAQRDRFDDIIAHPAHGADKMKVPHIRFDGRSPTLADVSVGGKPQVWNHKQNDAHGIFLIALASAVTKGLIRAGDLTGERHAVLMKFPAYFDAIKFETFEDAGAWEEINRRNTSSIGLVTRSLQCWDSLLFTGTPEGTAGEFRQKFLSGLTRVDGHSKSYWCGGKMTSLIERGLKTVRRQLALGGESPDYPPDDVRCRRADAYLTTLIVPSALGGLSERDLRQVLEIVETLKRPAGILRYENDSYQSGNYWIRKPGRSEKSGGLTETGDASSRAAFLGRFSNFMPHTEAQWFFDSLLVLARLHLASMTADPVQKRQDIHLATIHLKRALGQITGSFEESPLIAADGTDLHPFLAPESINTVAIDGRTFLLPSPIVPLNWAKASLSMALNRYEEDVFGK